MSRSSSFTIGLLMLAAAGVAGADVYRWVDSNHQVHFGDRVPAPYQRSAQRVDARVVNRGFDLPPAAVASAPAAAASAASAARAAGGSAPMGDASPQGQVTDADSCRARMLAYEQAEACFAPYRVKGGATRAEAFRVCKSVPQPQCD